MTDSHTMPMPSTQRWFFVFVLVGLAWSLERILTHQSAVGELFGRYSTRYGLAVLASIGVAFGWGLVFALRGWLWRLVGRMPTALVLTLLLLLGVATVVPWRVLGIESQLLHFASVNWFLLALFVTLGQPARAGGRFWMLLATLLCAAALVMLFITALTTRDYSPDEALYAANNSQWSVDGRIYRAPLLEEPYRIAPGVGWANVLHSLSLEHIAFHIQTGRVITFAFYGLAALMAGLLTRLLYGNFAALLTLFVMILGRSLFVSLDYRPNYFIAFAAMVVFYTALRPRLHPGRGGFFWHFLAGLLATLSLQLHALGVALALGMSFFYAGDFLWKLVRREALREALGTLIAFGLGALLGTAAYWVFNVQAVGGLETFLSVLLDERSSSVRRFGYLLFTPLEALFVVPGLLFLLIRRQREDRLYLALLSCAIVAKFLVDTQNYVVAYRVMLAIPSGALLVSLLRTPGSPPARDRRLNWLALWVVIALSGFAFTRKIDLSTVMYFVNNRELPPHSIHLLNDAIMEVVAEDAVVVGSIELIWGMQYREGFVAFPAEGYQGSIQGVNDLVGFWETIAPDVIVHIPQRDVMPAGLQSFIEQADYDLCQTIQVRGFDILFYRPTCPDA